MTDPRQDVNVYINFSLYAVLGMLAEADDMLMKYGSRIRRVAAYLTQQSPIQSVPLYRGMLVDRGAPVRLDERYRFVSWSEDRDVAVWFASRDSIVSEHVVKLKPTVRGVVLELTAPRTVLFHYSWAEGWADLAAMHPNMGPEGVRQIAWSLRTQREVITTPLEFPPAIDVDDIDHPPVAELDGRLAPPWISRFYCDDTATPRGQER